jgi:hypothetical protein
MLPVPFTLRRTAGRENTTLTEDVFLREYYHQPRSKPSGAMKAGARQPAYLAASYIPRITQVKNSHRQVKRSRCLYVDNSTYPGQLKIHLSSLLFHKTMRSNRLLTPVENNC